MKNKIVTEIFNKLLEVENTFIIEGVDIDRINKIVSFNKNHENNVDTSIILNPTINDINGVNVISIFKRKKSEESNLDGNPLIYALKGINGWKFKNEKDDIINLLKQFIRITEKIKTFYDTIIVIPSNNELNIKFLHRLNKIIKSKNIITDYQFKLTSEDVYENYIDWKQLNNDFPNEFNIFSKELDQYFNDMVDTNSGYFSYKYIKNNKLRKYITQTMGSSSDKTIEYSTFINDKDILILDDTIGYGQTISESTKIITETYTPKSIN